MLMRLAVLTSGGDAPGMNAALRAVVRTALHYGHHIYGIKNGYQGLINNEMVLMLREDVSGMLTKGGTFLGTARSKDFETLAGRDLAIRNLQKRNIEALIVIGGDGTFRGAKALSEMGINVIGIPATIDNDLGGTDFTIGFHTALNTIVEAIDKLRDTSSSHQRCSIVETMGRRGGDLAIFAGICGGAEFIITNEHMVDKDKMIKTLSNWKKEGRRQAIIVTIENIFNVHDLAEEISQKSGFATRATVLGYIQRGGAPVPPDRVLATQLGVYAVEVAMEGIFGVGVGVRRDKLVHAAFEDILNEKTDREGYYRLVDKVS
ncbi:MAG: 6-phosphofructokinase [Acholeplasmataceae bacterium]